MSGWGGEVFSAYNHWWIIPIFSCHMGAILGALLYLALIELHWPAVSHRELSDKVLHDDHPDQVSHHQHQHVKSADVKHSSLVQPGIGSNFLNVSFLLRKQLQ